MTRRTWLWLAKLGLGVGLLAVLAARADLAGVGERLAAVHLGWLALMVVLPHLAILLSTEKWRVLLRALGRGVSLGRLFVLYLIGTFANNFLPSMVGGDALRIWWLRSDRHDTSAVLAATFMERYVGLAGLITLLPLAALHRDIAGPYPAVRWFVLATVAGYVAATWLLFSRRRSFGWRALQAMERARDHVRSLSDARGPLAYSYVLSVVFYVLAAATVWVAARAVGAAIPLAFLVSVMPLVLLLGLLPISVNGLGLLETGYVVFLGLGGLSPETALAIALLLRMRILLTAAVGGLCTMVYRPRLDP